MKGYLATAVAGAFALLAITPALAISLTNEDETGYEVTIVEGEGDANSTTIQLDPGTNVSEICENGCTVKLDNGAEFTFEGDETATIKDGEFDLTE